VLLRLISEPEETEEDDDAKDGGPSSGFEQVDEGWGLVHDDPGELEDTLVPPVGISPRDPRADLGNRGVRGDSPNGDGDGDTKVERGQSNEAPVPAVGQIGIGSDEILELLAPLHEGLDGEEPVPRRDDRNDERPRPNENIGKVSVPGGRSTAEVFVDIEPVTRNNILQNHLQDGNSDCDQQVDNHLTTFLGSSGSHGGGGSDVVQTANDAETARGPGNHDGDLDADSDIAPRWRPINGISVPYNGVHEMNEAGERRPNHVHASPHIPRLQVPI